MVDNNHTGVPLSMVSFVSLVFLFSSVIFECQEIEAREVLLAIMLFYTLLSTGAVVCTSAWRSSSVYRD